MNQVKPQPHWSQQQNLHWPQRSKFKSIQQLVKGNPVGCFLNYPYLLHIHSTPTHISKLCFVPLFFLPLATLMDVGSIFWHLLWETSTLAHTTIVLNFASGVKIQRREKTVTAEHFWYLTGLVHWNSYRQCPIFIVYQCHFAYFH